MSVTKVSGIMQTSTKGGDIASASPTVIDTDGDHFDVTGTTNFAAFTVTAGRRFTLQFDGILTMTHHATNLDLPGGANITTAAGDVAEFFATGTNTVQCVNYTKADGTAVVSSAGGDSRNFIIDGDFTQWPEGTTVTAPSSNRYGPALWHASLSGGHVFNYVKETSVLPTLAQSGHSSKQCMKIDVTTAESSVASGERFLLDYVITGTDYQRLEAQEVTLSFWVRSGLTGTFYVTFKNGGDNRFYMSAQTIDSADTWEKKTITLTLDTAGGATWLYTEADQGLTIRITLMSGTDRQVGSAVDTWLTGSSQDSKSDQTNFLSDTSKDFYISQVGLYLGDTAPTFLPESVATVKDQVNYYVHTATNGIVGDSASNNIIDFGYAFPRPMRATPSVTLKDTTPQFFGGANFRTGSSPAYSAVSTNPLDKFGVAGRLTGFGTLLTTPRVHMSSNADVVMFLFDARH